MTNTRARFAPLSAENASPAVRPVLLASARQFGFLPSPVAKAARSPALLKHLLAGFGAFNHGSLGPIEREVVAMTVAFEMECHYCVSMHSALLSASSENGALVQALRAGAPLADARLEALRGFTRAIVLTRGLVPTERWLALESAGFSEEQSLDVVLGVGVYLLSTLTNIVTQAKLDAPFAEFAWTKPGA